MCAMLSIRSEDGRTRYCDVRFLFYHFQVFIKQSGKSKQMMDFPDMLI